MRTAYALRVQLFQSRTKLDDLLTLLLHQFFHLLKLCRLVELLTEQCSCLVNLQGRGE